MVSSVEMQVNDLVASIKARWRLRFDVIQNLLDYILVSDDAYAVA